MAQISMAALPALKDAYSQLKTRMDKAVEAFRKELTGQRTGRASVHMLDNIHVEAYGSQMPLAQVGNISAPEPSKRPFAARTSASIRRTTARSSGFPCPRSPRIAARKWLST